MNNKELGKKKSLLLVDTTSLSHKGKIYGHGAKVAQNWYCALSDYFNVKVAGSYLYKGIIPDEDFLQLPFPYNENDNTLVYKIKCILNGIRALCSKVDVIIFQNQFITPVYVAIHLFPKKKRKKIYIIEYSNPIDVPNRPNEGRWFLKIQNKINGIITSLTSVSESVSCRSYVIPDYFPEKSFPICKNKTIDFVVLGTASYQKDYEMVVDALNRTNYTCVIAGNFEDKARYRKLKNLASDNVTIVDQYLSEDQYTSYIEASKFVILPYNREHYSEKSSGVVLEALYLGVPVIVPDVPSFSFVRENELGLLYNRSILEVLRDYPDSVKYQDSIRKYIEGIEHRISKFVEFLEDDPVKGGIKYD